MSLGDARGHAVCPRMPTSRRRGHDISDMDIRAEHRSGWRCLLGGHSHVHVRQGMTFRLTHCDRLACQVRCMSRLGLHLVVVRATSSYFSRQGRELVPGPGLGRYLVHNGPAAAKKFHALDWLLLNCCRLSRGPFSQPCQGLWPRHPCPTLVFSPATAFLVSPLTHPFGRIGPARAGPALHRSLPSTH